MIPMPMGIILVMFALVFSGCLRTRNDMQGGAEARHSQPTYNTPQATDYKGIASSNNGDSGPNNGAASGAAAVSDTQPIDTQELMRQLLGRVEVLENDIQTLKNTQANDQAASIAREQEINAKITLLTESVAKLEAQSAAGGGAASAKAAANDNSGNNVQSNPWLQAEEDFKNKNWRSAIANYQKYRMAQPNGKNYAPATYKMALAFQELGLKQDAKAFFDEVITRFPNSEHAKKAQFRVKQLK